MASCEDDDYYYEEAGEFYDDFCVEVRKKEKPKQCPKQLNADTSVASVIKKCQQLHLWPVTLDRLQKLVIDKKILSIGDIIKSDGKSIEIVAVANTKVKPFENMKDENVIVELFRDETEFKGPIHMFSRYTPIGDEETDDVYEPVTSGMKYDHESVTLLRLQDIVISKMFYDSKTLAQVINENPNKILKIFQEIMNLILDVEINDHFFWSHNSSGAKNIFWWNQKWVVLNGEFKVANAGFISNLIKILDLFHSHGMSKKQLENEFWKAFQDNVWRRRPRYVCRRIQKQYFNDD